MKVNTYVLVPASPLIAAAGTPFTSRSPAPTPATGSLNATVICVSPPSGALVPGHTWLTSGPTVSKV